MAGQAIDLSNRLRMRTAFLFPLQSTVARKEVLIGAAWLLVPGIGWILNMGHRIMMTHRMQNGEPAWPAWRDYPLLFKHGLIAFVGMVEYHAPAVLCEWLALRYQSVGLHVLAAGLWILGTIAVPGYMTHYCHKFDPMEVFNPIRACRRVLQGGRRYWHAWGIALAALACSFLGLLAFGVGFLITSVWFWQVAGFSFSTVFTERYGLYDNGLPRRDQASEEFGAGA